MIVKSVAVIGVSIFVAGCQYAAVQTSSSYRSDTEREPLIDYGDQQGWSHKERNWFYNTSQGSQVINYDWILALEQPNNSQPFLADDFMENLRMIPRGFDPQRPDRKAHLPIGFVKDGRRNQLGLTCAACHTSQLEYGGSTLRIDGAGTLSDFVGFIDSLTDSIDNTVNRNAKFERFTRRVKRINPSAAHPETLKQELEGYLNIRKSYAFRNRSAVVDGYGRLDAFGRIYNKALHVANPTEDVFGNLRGYRNATAGKTYHPPNAPVSYPFLWGIDQSDYVQWVGLADNANVGTLGRNVGEVMGVFANVEYKKRLLLPNFKSSARMHSLINLEQSVRKLESPSWESYQSLPPIDHALASRGATLYNNHCASCHLPVERTNRRRFVQAMMEKIDVTPDNPKVIGTDPRTAVNIVDRRGKTGILAGDGILGLNKVEEEEPVLKIVKKVAGGMILARLDAAFRVLYTSVITGRGLKAKSKNGNIEGVDPLRAYRGRSMNGAWATAPYLHNGSVPNMWELLKPAHKRTKKFYVGSRVFDPKNMGLEHRRSAGNFLFDTTKPANSNAGHEYGANLTDAQKWAIIEFMKTDMNP